MKQIFTLIILTYLCPQLGFSQKGSIKGAVSDSSISAGTTNAVVSVLQSTDSTLVSFTRTDKNGNFSINQLNPGNYLLLITYPKYGDYVETFDLKENQNLDLNHIYLTEKAKLLEEIVIRQAAIRIKGDTTEFTADSFYVKPNASVEDLLKELPGISVDKNGKITAQGQQVQKVLVDGDEFFSDDPTIATKNLRADAIDKVQVFDKKTDQAVFSGIDDGVTTKTLNLKLKENAKKGYFGKVSVAGLDKYYNATAMINAFKAKRKLSAFGVVSSTNETGLNFSDSRSLGFNDLGNVSFSSDGGMSVTVMGGGGSSDGGLGSGNSYGSGLPESAKAGALYSNKWGEGDKYSAGGNYLFNNLAQRNAGNTYSQNTLEDSVYYTRNSSSSHSNKMQNSLKGQTEIQLDSSSSLKVTAGGYVGTNDSYGDNTSSASDENNQLVNSSVGKNSSKGNSGVFNASVIWRKKFKKPGRTVSITFDERYNQSNSNGLLYNDASFYNAEGDIFRSQITDQNKVNNTLSNVMATKISYTEPLSKKTFIELNYSLNNNNSNQSRLSYNKDDKGKYTDFVDSLSSDFKYIYNTNSGGINFRYNEKKYNFSAGGNISNTSFNQTDNFKDNDRKYSYLNFFPQANFSYKFNSFSNLRLSYNGSTTQPTIDQIQPLKNNDDPLNIVIGNPDLNQQFNNLFSLNYSNFQLINERFIFLGGGYSFVKNQISNSYTIDTAGRRISQYINVNGNYNYNIYGSYSMKIPNTQIKAGFSPNLNFNKNTSFVNGKKNISNNFSFNPSVRISTNKPEKYEVSLNLSPSYTNSTSSISKAAAQRYWTYNFGIDGNVSLPAKIELGTDIDFNFREKLNAFDNNNNAILWNAYAEKKFLKNDVLTLRFSMQDILDQNKGYNREVSPTATTETNSLTFQRYGLITLTYNINNKGAAPRSSGRGSVIRF